MAVGVGADPQEYLDREGGQKAALDQLQLVMPPVDDAGVGLHAQDDRVGDDESEGTDGEPAGLGHRAAAAGHEPTDGG
ncbi:hypothetical protein [Streptomyces capitiformicae]|uniref:Uncharacterized protein n=1 Tax=Streptomyces capitiformicae TaxID=2014920 RepID=A0A918ZW13_9ACTN|nr:hypothetical protein [Streptomyces capitiformicae]GHE71030.1 hypothetical protein GCM10017771_94930 [Streptomyces capitiformicae]